MTWPNGPERDAPMTFTRRCRVAGPTASRARGAARLSGVAALLLIFALLAGCRGLPMLRGGGALSLQSLGDDPVMLRAEYSTAVYGHDTDRGTSFIVSDLEPEELRSGEFTDGQVLHVVLLWVPLAGATPMDPTATNASVRHVVFSGGEMGIYGGAGFIVPGGRLGRTVRLDIRQATLTLLESTEGFVDVLGAAKLTGSLTAEHDPLETRRVYFNVCQRVTDVLGRSRFVLGDGGGEAEADVRHAMAGAGGPVRR